MRWWRELSAASISVVNGMNDPLVERLRTYLHCRGTSDAFLEDIYRIKVRVKLLARQGLLTRQIVSDAEDKTWAQYRALSWCKCWCVTLHAVGLPGTFLSDSGTEGVRLNQREYITRFAEGVECEQRGAAVSSGAPGSTTGRLGACIVEWFSSEVVRVVVRHADGERTERRGGWELGHSSPLQIWFWDSEDDGGDIVFETTGELHPQVQGLSARTGRQGDNIDEDSGVWVIWSSAFRVNREPAKLAEDA